MPVKRPPRSILSQAQLPVSLSMTSGEPSIGWKASVITPVPSLPGQVIGCGRVALL